MKTLNLTKIYFSIIALIFAFAFFMGCSDMNPMDSPSNPINQTDELNGVTINIQTGHYAGHEAFFFYVTNGLSDTINDFHLQMVDSTVIIRDPNTLNSNWKKAVTGATTGSRNKSTIDLFTSRGIGYNPIRPGQTKEILVFWVPQGTTNRDYNFQATKDGVVIFAGTGRLPNP